MKNEIKMLMDAVEEFIYGTCTTVNKITINSELYLVIPYEKLLEMTKALDDLEGDY